MATARFKLNSYVQQSKEAIFSMRVHNLMNKENSFEQPQTREKTQSYHHTNSLEMFVQPPKSARPPLFDRYTPKQSQKAPGKFTLNISSIDSSVNVRKSKNVTPSRIKLMLALEYIITARKRVALDRIKHYSFFGTPTADEFITFTTVTIETRSSVAAPQQQMTINRILSIYESKLLVRKMRALYRWRGRGLSDQQRDRRLEQMAVRYQTQRSRVGLMALALQMQKFQRIKQRNANRSEYYLPLPRERPEQRESSLVRNRKRSIFD